jgi:predicted TIM-barrel fold metal-dependent hydrolase
VTTRSPIVVDSHVHVDPTRFAPIEILERAMADAGVDRAVLVQNMGGRNEYLADAVRRAPHRFAAAMWIDPADSGRLIQLRKWAESGVFRGIRLFAETIESEQESWHRAAELGLAVIMVSFLKSGLREIEGTLLRFASAHPECCIVITRFGLASGDPLSAIPLAAFGRLSELPNVSVEVSLFPDRVTGRPSRDVEFWIRALLELFGPSRMTFGSGFPARDPRGVVADPATRYVDEFAAVKAGVLKFSPAIMSAVLDKTPHRVWFPGHP